MTFPTALLAFVGCAPNTTPAPDPRGGVTRVHAAVAGSAVAPLPQEPSWTVQLDQAYADLGNTVSSAGDVNADGYDDVLIGVPNYTNDQLNEGRAYLYLGSASGLSATEDWSAESDQAFSEFGSTVAQAGDVNGDGYDDVLVGAPSYTGGQTDEGRVYLYLGSISGLSPTHAWAVESDQASSSFGSAISSAGDVNADGYDDVIVGAYNYSNGHSLEGRAYLYLGSASGLSVTAAWTAEANQLSASFGWSVSSAGDVDADGYDDVLVGAFSYSNGEGDEGRAYLYLGSASGLSVTAAWTAEADQASAYFGRSVASAGDVNADGYSDVLIGASRYSNGQSFEGRAYLYLGSASGLSVTEAWTAEPDLGDISFGWSVSSAGDADADGYDDVVIGARYYTGGETEEGRAYLYLGDASGLSSAAAWSAESDNTYAYFGSSVASAGDVDADGYDDVIIGAPNYTDLEIGEGYAALYLGSCGEQTWYADLDGDTYGDPLDTIVSCTIPDGFVLNGEDCDDGSDAVNPEAQEQCDGSATDEDCDGLLDDADPSVLGQTEWYTDEDDDGFGAGLPTLACEAPAGTVPSATDCDDTSADFYPGAPEDCADPTDYNCDELVSYEDNDGDNFAACEECDDADPDRNPDAAERCNDTDDDCDGAIDEDATDPMTFEADADGDGFTDREAPLQACVPPEGYLAPSAQADCDDASPSVYPDAPEVPGDGIDQDCDGEDAEETEEDTEADGPGGGKEVGCGCAASPLSGWPAVAWLLALTASRARSGSSGEPGDPRPRER